MLPLAFLSVFLSRLTTLSLPLISSPIATVFFFWWWMLPLASLATLLSHISLFCLPLPSPAAPPDSTAVLPDVPTTPPDSLSLPPGSFSLPPVTLYPPTKPSLAPLVTFSALPNNYLALPELLSAATSYSLAIIDSSPALPDLSFA